jgi:hypothetical protein
MSIKNANLKATNNEGNLNEEKKTTLPLHQKRKEIIFQSITENESASKVDNGYSRYHNSDKTISAAPKRALKELEVYQSSDHLDHNESSLCIGWDASCKNIKVETDEDQILHSESYIQMSHHSICKSLYQNPSVTNLILQVMTPRREFQTQCQSLCSTKPQGQRGQSRRVKSRSN